MRHTVSPARAATPSAASITVEQTLALLDGPFEELSQGIANGSYTLWLGSGISRDKVDGLEILIAAVLEYLRNNIVETSSDCTFRRNLDRAIELAQPSDVERPSIDYTNPVSSWGPVGASIINRLKGQYSRLLDLRPRGMAVDHLLWEVIGLTSRFADDALDPDCEHLCVAILAIEGLLPNIATANWDNLIERAVQQLAGDSEGVLRTCVVGEDFRSTSGRSNLLKMHGCAARARDDETAYRQLIIGRQSQIEDWATSADSAVMRNELIHLATITPTLMVGLSAQDGNIRGVFTAAKAVMAWRWPSHPPALLFAEDALGPDQTTMLSCVYRSDYDANPEDVTTSAQIRAFAKPLLVAIVLTALCRKLVKLISCASGVKLPQSDLSMLDEGVKALRNRAAELANGDKTTFIRVLIANVTHILRILRGVLGPTTGKYHALGIHPISQIAGDPSNLNSGTPEFAAALGLLGVGVMSGEWQLGGPDISALSCGSFTIQSQAASSPQKLFFVANSEVAVRLIEAGVITESNPDVILIHSIERASRIQRSPHSSFGRTGTAAMREISMRTLLADATDLTALKLRFREEAAI